MAEMQRILVIDDTQSMRVAAKSALGSDYEVLCCEDGLKGISMIAEFKPDLVFMDIMMPNLDGYETVALIRLNDAFKDVPIVMMSSKGGVFDLARGKLLGFSGFIVKPFQPHDLRQAIVDHIGEPVIPE